MMGETEGWETTGSAMTTTKLRRQPQMDTEIWTEERVVAIFKRMQVAEKRPWYRNGLVPLIALLLTLIGAVVSFGRLLEEIDQLNKSVATVRDRMVEKQEMYDKLDAQSGKINDLKEQLNDVKQRLSMIEQRTYDHRP